MEHPQEEEHVKAMSPCDEEGVRALARAAALPLTDDRVSQVADLLGTWLTAANELSRTMSDAAHLSLMPATFFVHPTAEPTE